MKSLSSSLIVVLITLLLVSACRTSQTVSIPKGVPVVTRSQWGAATPVLEMKQHVPNRITIHHTATNQNASRTLEQKLKALQKFSMERSPLSDGRIKEPWADIPYHFYISVDGRIGEGRALQYVGDSNTPYDPTGHALIVLEGNFNKEQVTEAQYQSLLLLTKAIAKRWKIPAATISGHKDNATTACPGEALYNLLPKLREDVASIEK
ncbi:MULTISPECIES: peptidoglycan recognition protein family protein [Rufibacter]|uniref:N-acetyl-anhydromuramyl-L-alanine amidase AmpD n=1 Tax=Rufibacter quisquiliarum TaxID=1549639 RepID=A0A839GR42_9BACT|nr:MULTISPECIES: peptidoglycan recognition family protein [Rufibacter]MBA9077336.1 N-acetyl-anhydromuramyl-L-alanine amidase AmpD [Rufibacter quisquiliarum]